MPYFPSWKAYTHIEGSQYYALLRDGHRKMVLFLLIKSNVLTVAPAYIIAFIQGIHGLKR